MAIPFLKSNARLREPTRGQAPIVDPKTRDVFETAAATIGGMMDGFKNARNTSEYYSNVNKAKVRLNEIYNESQADDFSSTEAYKDKLQALDDEFKFTDDGIRQKFLMELAADKTKTYIDITNNNLKRGHDNAISVLNETTQRNTEQYRISTNEQERTGILERHNAMIDEYKTSGIISAVDAQKRKEASKSSFNLEHAYFNVDTNPEQALKDLKAGAYDLSREDNDKAQTRALQKIERDKKAQKLFTKEQQFSNAFNYLGTIISGNASVDEIENISLGGNISSEYANLFIEKLTNKKALVPKTDKGVFIQLVRKITEDDTDKDEAMKMLLEANVRGVKVKERDNKIGRLSDDDMMKLIQYKMLGQEASASADAFGSTKKPSVFAKQFSMACKMISSPLFIPMGAAGSVFNYFQSKNRDHVENKIYDIYNRFFNKFDNSPDDDPVKMAQESISEVVRETHTEEIMKASEKDEFGFSDGEEINGYVYIGNNQWQEK